MVHFHATIGFFDQSVTHFGVLFSHDHIERELHIFSDA